MKNSPKVLEWVSMPTNWVRFGPPGLDRFPVSRLGASVTALKLYLAIASARAASAKPGKVLDSVPLSYDDLMRLTGSSRGMVGPSLTLLDGLVEVEQGQGRQTNEYAVIGFPPAGGGWAKLPAAHLLRTNALTRFEPRARSDLAALKMYILLMALRDNDTGWAQLSYERAAEYMSTTRDYVSRAISKLIETNLVIVRQAHEVGLVDSFEARRNLYAVKGLRRSAAEAATT